MSMTDNSEFVRSVEDAVNAIIASQKGKVNRACLEIERQAKQDCPVDEGVLRNSIMSDVEIENNCIVGRIGSILEYAPYVHQGTGIYAVNGDGRKKPWGYVVKSGKYKGKHYTVGQKPQPFLKNAVIKKRNRIEEILGG